MFHKCKKNIKKTLTYRIVYYIILEHYYSEVKFMKQNIHPNYHEVEVVCVCGAKFKTKSTVNGDTINVDICKECHPFYSGKQKLVDTAGRVESFKKKHNLD